MCVGGGEQLAFEMTACLRSGHARVKIEADFTSTSRGDFHPAQGERKGREKEGGGREEGKGEGREREGRGKGRVSMSNQKRKKGHESPTTKHKHTKTEPHKHANTQTQHVLTRISCKQEDTCKALLGTARAPCDTTSRGLVLPVLQPLVSLAPPRHRSLLLKKKKKKTSQTLSRYGNGVTQSRQATRRCIG